MVGVDEIAPGWGRGEAYLTPVKLDVDTYIQQKMVKGN